MKSSLLKEMALCFFVPAFCDTVVSVGFVVLEYNFLYFYVFSYKITLLSYGINIFYVIMEDIYDETLFNDVFVASSKYNFRNIKLLNYKKTV